MVKEETKALITATNNKKKLQEISDIMSAYGFKIYSQSEAGINIKTKETGNTFEENAILKAEDIYNAIHLSTIADDSGLVVDALNGAPGVLSARYASDTGKNADDTANYTLLLENMKDIPIQKRSARFVCAICYIDIKGDRHIFKGECKGFIGFEPKGTGGFGYDPVFFTGEKSFAELGANEKNKISHRAGALKGLAEYLKNNYIF